MPINKNVFIHEADRAALQTLKAIPGFTQALRALMKVWDENLMRILNMSTNVKISEKQLPKYRAMLSPICDKLGIEEPDLFLTLDVRPNAWTSGDSKPYITITSGLIETLPEYLIPSVLAHECGHIACHHVLYRTMGDMILRGALSFVPIKFSGFAEYPIEAAFAYWMRCSELSADRAAALCDGTVDHVVESCMRFAGFDKDIPHEMNVEAFISQANEYQEMVKNNVWNKAMEFMMFGKNDHPINAVRAYEIKKWEKTEDFVKSKQYFEAYKKEEKVISFPLLWNEKHLLGRNYEEVEQELLEIGFHNVELIRETEKSFLVKAGNVINVDINGSDKYKDGDWVSADSKVEVKYYLPLTEEEIAALHVGEIKIPNPPSYYKGKEYSAVVTELQELGFENIITEEIRDISKDKDKNLGKVASMAIDKRPKFSKGDWFNESAEIKLIYHSKE